MPRARSFDPEEALAHAMRVFWRSGYAGASLRQLISKMGVNKFSFYETFGSKQKLFLASLDLYRDQIASALLAELESPHSGVEEIRAYFDRLVEGATTRQDCEGCLMTNTATELAFRNAQVKRRVRNHMDRVRRAMLSALEHSVERNELNPSARPELLARHLLAASQSMAVAAKTRAKAEDFRGYTTWLVESLHAR